MARAPASAAGDGSPAGAEGAASFIAGSKRSASLAPSRVSGSINSSAGSAGLALRGPALAAVPEDDGVSPTGAPPSMGASTGRPVSGSKTGRDAASIVSSLVNSSSHANGSHGTIAAPLKGPFRRARGTCSGERSADPAPHDQVLRLRRWGCPYLSNFGGPERRDGSHNGPRRPRT